MNGRCGLSDLAGEEVHVYDSCRGHLLVAIGQSGRYHSTESQSMANRGCPLPLKSATIYAL